MSSAVGGGVNADSRLGIVSRGAWIAMAALLALIALGLWAHHLQETQGLLVTSMRSPGQGGAAWGLHISLDAYFVGLSFVGILVSALARILKSERLQPLTRIGELMTIIALMISGLFVLSDLGRPLAGLMNLPKYARVQSPFFGTFTLVVSGTLFTSLAYFFLSGRADAARVARQGPPRLRWLYRLWASGYRDTPVERRLRARVNYWLALFVIPLLVLAHSTLGFIFGIQGGRPGWFNALQAPGFVVLSACSGLGMLILIAAAVRSGLDLRERLPDATFRLLGNSLAALTLVYLYFTIVEQLTATYAAARAEAELARQILVGDFAPAFWLTVAAMILTFLITFWQFVTRRTSVGWLVVAGLLINAATLIRRLLIVVPSQTHGTLLPYDEPHRGYVPTFQEIAAAVGVSALGVLLYIVFVHLFPIIATRRPWPSELPAGEALELAPRRRLRLAALFATLGLGLVLTAAGLLWSARIGTVWFADPIVPYSPVIFITGVMLSFGSAIVYELIPPAPRNEHEPA